MNELGHKYYQIALLESVKHIMLSGQVVDAILLILAVLVVVADYENIVIY